VLISTDAKDFMSCKIGVYMPDDMEDYITRSCWISGQLFIFDKTNLISSGYNTENGEYQEKTSDFKGSRKYVAQFYPYTVFIFISGNIVIT
ncbi:MAG: hypothetical protein MHPSP_004449, partial [Paramarteilia canceri]